MGLSRMQGTSAFLEYIGERKVKKYSCKNCKNYFDGVCKIKKIIIEYGDNSGKLCKEFSPICIASGEKSTSKNKNNTNAKADEKNNSDNVIVSIRTIGNKKEKLKIIKDVVTFGSKVIIQEVQLENDKYEIEVLEGKTRRELLELVINHGVGYQFKYKAILYKIVSIK